MNVRGIPPFSAAFCARFSASHCDLRRQLRQTPQAAAAETGFTKPPKPSEPEKRPLPILEIARMLGHFDHVAGQRIGNQIDAAFA